MLANLRIALAKRGLSAGSNWLSLLVFGTLAGGIMLATLSALVTAVGVGMFDVSILGSAFALGAFYGCIVTVTYLLTHLVIRSGR